MAHSYQKRLEIGLLFILGYTCNEIEDKTDVSHGSVVEIIADLKTGKLHIPGLPTEEVGTLRQLAVELKNNGYQAEQAMLGATFYYRCAALGIEPASLELWVDLINKFVPVNFPAQDFFKAALNLYRLEQSENASYGDLNQKFTEYKATRDALLQETTSLFEKQQQLTAEVTNLENDKAAKQQTDSQAQAKLESLNGELEKAKERLAKETGLLEYIKNDRQSLMAKNCEIASQIGAREESLTILKNAGFSETQLFRLRNIIVDQTTNKNTSPKDIADQFFAAVEKFGGLAGLESATVEKEQHIGLLEEKKAALAGKIQGLKNEDAFLTAKIKTDAEAAAEIVKKGVNEASQRINEFAGAIEKRVRNLVDQAAETGLIIGREIQAQLCAEQSATELDTQIEVVQKHLGNNHDAK